ncbi:MAG: hypothetical protein RR203_07700 [Synergistaceae bacterium]
MFSIETILINIKLKKTFFISLSLISLLFLQLGTIKYLERKNQTLLELERELSTLDKILSTKTDALVLLKRNSNLSVDNKLIESFESQTAFYTYLINILKTNAIDNVSISQEEATESSLMFKVTGKADYPQLLQLFISIRESRYMTKIVSFTLLNSNNNMSKIDFEFLITGKFSLEKKNEEVINE